MDDHAAADDELMDRVEEEVEDEEPEQEEMEVDEEEAMVGEEVDEEAEGEVDGTDAAIDPAAATNTKTLKRPMSAYFLFMQTKRTEIMTELDAAAEKESIETGQPVKSQSKNLGVIGKLVGDRWKAMADEEKQPYLDQAKEAKEKYEEAIRLDPSLKPIRMKESPSGGSGSLGVNEFVIPLGRIKKLMSLDNLDKEKDKNKATKEAQCLIEKATERFLIYLVERAHTHTTLQKRKGLKSQDLEHIVRTTGKLEFLRAPLKRDFERFAQMEQAASEIRKDRMQQMHAKKKQKNEEGKQIVSTNEEEATGDTSAPQMDESDESKENREPIDPAASSSPPKPKSKPIRTIDSMFGKKV